MACLYITKQLTDAFCKWYTIDEIGVLSECGQLLSTLPYDIIASQRESITAGGSAPLSVDAGESVLYREIDFKPVEISERFISESSDGLHPAQILFTASGFDANGQC